MEPEISVGDLLVVRPYNFADVTVGDDIVYQNADPTSPIYGQNVVHRVIEVGDDENGHYLITKGVNNNEADVSPVREENFVGIKAFHSAALGAILLFFTKMENWIILVVIFVCAIIVVQAVRQMVKAVREQRKKGNQPSPKNETHS
jgi:signal peptidase I